MSNDLAVNRSNDDDVSYYSRSLRRTVKKPTPVLFNMIRDIRYEYNEVLEYQICERCKTHPDDVNWIQAHDQYYQQTPFFILCVLNESYDIMMDKARDAMIESDSFRVVDEFHILHTQQLYIEVHQRLIKKLIVLKPNDVIKVFKNHDLSFDAATVIVSYLYGMKEQLAVLNVLMGQSYNIECTSYHLIDDWISVDPKVLSNEEICLGMVYSIEDCTKACCALILLRNIKISIELLPVRRNDRRIQICIINCLKNKCICMSDDLVKLSLEIQFFVTSRRNIDE